MKIRAVLNLITALIVFCFGIVDKNPVILIIAGILFATGAALLIFSVKDKK